MAERRSLRLPGRARSQRRPIGTLVQPGRLGRADAGSGADRRQVAPAAAESMAVHKSGPIDPCAMRRTARSSTGRRPRAGCTGGSRGAPTGTAAGSGAGRALLERRGGDRQAGRRSGGRPRRPRRRGVLAGGGKQTAAMRRGRSWGGRLLGLMEDTTRHAKEWREV